MSTQDLGLTEDQGFAVYAFIPCGFSYKDFLVDSFVSQYSLSAERADCVRGALDDVRVRTEVAAAPRRRRRAERNPPESRRPLQRGHLIRVRVRAPDNRARRRIATDRTALSVVTQRRDTGGFEMEPTVD